MDTSGGTTQDIITTRFPNGLPAVSEDSMEAWMEYAYMQQIKPTNATGVPVTITVVDANGNYRTIGRTTSDATGFYKLSLTPEIAGKYTVYATFGGQNHTTHHRQKPLYVDEPAATYTSPSKPSISLRINTSYQASQPS